MNGAYYKKDYYIYKMEEITKPMVALFIPDNTAKLGLIQSTFVRIYYKKDYYMYKMEEKLPNLWWPYVLWIIQPLA